MKWKTTLLLLLAAVGVGSYVSLYELRQPDPEQRERRSRMLLPVKPEAITRVDWALPNATATLTRDDAGWRLSPDGLRADPEAVERLLDDLTFLVSLRTLEESGGELLALGAYGLKPPVGRLVVEAGVASMTLLFGERTAVEANRYVQLAGRPEVFVISDLLFENLSRPPEHWREKPAPPSAPAALQDKAPGAQDALQDGQVNEDGQQQQGPPKEVAPERAPGHQDAGGQAGEIG
ncbi:MAG: DUF4340 domain-containing protein [Candidatus Omnitrophica bacterium]|nr:DUF4340 domain-containing protein [Candidatus Omnitrophota bacterium]